MLHTKKVSFFNFIFHYNNLFFLISLDFSEVALVSAEADESFYFFYRQEAEDLKQLIS